MNTQTKTHVLVVDDDDRLRSLLQQYLHGEHFMVTAVESAAKAREAMGWFVFDVLVLDVMMPGETGLELLASLPDERPPVLMLSAMGEAPDRIKGLEVGADDYLSKPFEPKELTLRLNTILRRHSRESAPTQNAGIARFGEYVFDMSLNQLRQHDQQVYLTPSELAMLAFLAARAGKPAARQELSELIPGGSSERSVDVQINRLRKKIEPNPGKPVYLQTKRGAGYVLYATRDAKAGL